MMRQYVEVKKQHPDKLLMYRLGDFYELFFDDAVTASRELELVLTGRDCGLPERAPMCGVPHHAVDGYISRLVEKGYRVVVCEQMEDPAAAKGIVRRDIVRIVTPGTLTDTGVLEEARHNYIASLYLAEGGFGLAVADVSTGELQLTEAQGSVKTAVNELSRFSPSELLYSEAAQAAKPVSSWLGKQSRCSAQLLYRAYFELEPAKDLLSELFTEQQLKPVTKLKNGWAVAAAGALLRY
ncbi:MAG: DNA mismatch repair protein MutS, partial [Oscillospiraceae bacterium]|nr:DNA mismatch repair protein MutS [Oscillospiraceae bacterium]